jgi:DNA-binding LacI/PurR family transcriptional regulator
LCNTDEDPAKQRDYLRALTAERVAEAIISPTEADAPEISEVIDHGSSVVAYDRAVGDRRALTPSCQQMSKGPGWELST